MFYHHNFVSGTDRFGTINSSEHHVEKLLRKLKFPVEDILKAVQEVGFDKEEVEEYIRDRYNRS
jgi:hypothetical protein